MKTRYELGLTQVVRSSREHRQLALLPLLAVLFTASPTTGCSRDEEAASQKVFRTQIVETPAPAQEPASTAPATYSFEFHKPKPGDFKPGEPIDVSASLTVTPSENPPASVQLLVRKKDLNLDSRLLEPKQDKKSETYDFETSIKAPMEIGPFELVLMAIETKAYVGGEGEHVVRNRTVYSKPLVLRVRR